MNRIVLLSLSLVILLAQGCATDRPKVYPPAPVTPEYSVKMDWANLQSPLGVDKYSWLVPAVTENAVYVAERNGRISSFNLLDGKLIWQKHSPYQFSAGPSFFEGVIYVGTSEAGVAAFDATNGEMLWFQQVSSEILVPPQSNGDRVIVRSNDGKVFGLRPKDGKVLWAYDRSVPALTLRGNSIPAFMGKNVIVGFANGRLISLALLDGKTNWEAAISLPKGRTELERMVDIDGPLHVKDGVIYVSAYNGKTAAVDADTGSILWTRDVPSYLGGMADEKNFYLTDSKGNVWALNRESGSTLWMQDKLQERASTRPLIHNNKLVIGDALGELYWLSPADGRILGHLPHDRASKLSHATYYIDEFADPEFDTPRRDETAVIFEPRVVGDRLVVTYQNGIVATIVSPE